MPRRQITLSELIQDYGDYLKATMYHTLPGVVKAYYSDGTADVQPAVNDVRFDPDTSERISEKFPIIPRVKIMYPCGGAFTITWPLQAGDKVTLHAYDLDPTVHRQTGGVEDPQDVRRHGGSYWQAVPGDVTDSATHPTTGKMVLDGPAFAFGAGAADFAALASKVDACMAAIKTHTHVVSVPGVTAGPTTVAGTAAPSTDLTTLNPPPGTGSNLVAIKS